MPASGDGRFYAAGLRFSCQQTGRCCTARGGYGYVYLSREDRRRLAAHLGMRTSSFTRRYCRKDENALWALKDPDKDCLFLEGHGCGVYEARPTQCRTWPFWPENMSSRSWEREVLSFCAGAGKGRLYSAEEIEALLAQDTLQQP